MPETFSPTPQQYATALRDPATAFLDPRLRQSTTVPGARGAPVQRIGQHTVVFRLDAADGTRYALRCFLRPSPAEADRYRALASHLTRHGVPEVCVWEWLDDAVTVQGHRLPALLSQWRGGSTLGVAMTRHNHDSDYLRLLADRWVALVGRLEQARIAHGDLQHGNILVEGDTFSLVDPDGMWTPTVSRMPPPAEAGHPNYRHPRTTVAHWGPYADRFSAHVIALSLRAVAADASLWRRYHDDNNLIFAEPDLGHPGVTPIWYDLAASPDPWTRLLAQHLAVLCATAPERVPSLTQTLAALPAAPVAGGVPPHLAAGSPPGATRPHATPPHTTAPPPRAAAPPAAGPSPTAATSRARIGRMLAGRSRRGPGNGHRQPPTAPTGPPPALPAGVAWLLALTLMAVYAARHLPAPPITPEPFPTLLASGTWLCALAGLLFWPRSRPVLTAVSGGAAAALLALHLPPLATALNWMWAGDRGRLIPGVLVVALICALLVAVLHATQSAAPPPAHSLHLARHLYAAGVLGVVLSEGAVAYWSDSPWSYSPSGIATTSPYGITAAVAGAAVLACAGFFLRLGAGWPIGLAVVLAARPLFADDLLSWRDLPVPWAHTIPLLRWSAIGFLTAAGVVLARSWPSRPAGAAPARTSQ